MWIDFSFHLLCSYLLSFLVRVAANSDKNKMAPSNIATVFAPALLRCAFSLAFILGAEAIGDFPSHRDPSILRYLRRLDQDPMASMVDTPKINSIVVVLLQYFDYIFRVRPKRPPRTLLNVTLPE